MNKKAVNKRFIEAIEWLISIGKAESKSEIAKKANISPSKFSEILNCRMNIGTDLAGIVCLNYGISAEWLLTGQGTMAKSNAAKENPQHKTQIPKPPTNETVDSHLLIDKICELSAENALLKKELELLQEEKKTKENSVYDHG